MASKGFGAIALTGGGTGALDKIDGDLLTDGDVAIVVDATTNLVWKFTLEANPGIAESSPWTTNLVIAPDTNGGTKRWVLCDEQSVRFDDMRTFLAADTLKAGLVALGVAYDYVWIPAKAWTPRATNGCQGIADNEYAANDLMFSYLAFDGGAVNEAAQFNMVMPPAWDRSTVKFKVIYTGAAGCAENDKVVWGLSGVSSNNDEAIDVAQGTSTYVLDLITAGVEADLHITSATGAVTFAGTPAIDEVINIQIERDVADDSGHADDMAEDAWMFGVLMQYGLSNKVSAW